MSSRPDASGHPPAKTGGRGASRALDPILGLAGIALLAAVAFGVWGIPSPAGPAGQSVPVVASGAAYGGIVRDVGGPYVSVHVIPGQPNARTVGADAAAVASARLAVQTGPGEDPYMDGLESAAPDRRRLVVRAADAAGGRSGAGGTLGWYAPGPAARLARVVAGDLAELSPAHAAYFRSRARAFAASLGPWRAVVARVRRGYRGVPVAAATAAADGLLAAMGLAVRTPPALQEAIDRGTPAPASALRREAALLSSGAVRLLVYDRQKAGPTVRGLVLLARRRHVPVVGLYGTLPGQGTYPATMAAQSRAILRALKDGRAAAPR